MVAKQQNELKTNHSNEKGSRLGDSKPLTGSPQSRRHKLSRMLPRPVKRRQGDGRIIPGRTRIQKHQNHMTKTEA